jgi:hypothetical protein
MILAYLLFLRRSSSRVESAGAQAADSGHAD